MAMFSRDVPARLPPHFARSDQEQNKSFEETGGNSKCGWYLHQGPCSYMEDRIFVDNAPSTDDTPSNEFYAVLDGHGGTQAVEFIKARLPVAIRQHSAYLQRPQDLESAFRESFEITERELVAFSRDNPTDRAKKQLSSSQTELALTPGCVGCIAVLTGTFLSVAWLGDCRALLCCDGRVDELTTDHTPKDNECEQARLRALGVGWSADGYVHGRLGVSRAFGDWDLVNDCKCPGLSAVPEICQKELPQDAEFLLIGCDGIFENMNNLQAIQTVRKTLRTTGGDAQASSQALIEDALKLKGADNLSAVVVVFKPPVEIARTAPRRFFGKARRATPGTPVCHTFAVEDCPKPVTLVENAGSRGTAGASLRSGNHSSTKISCETGGNGGRDLAAADKQVDSAATLAAASMCH